MLHIARGWESTLRTYSLHACCPKYIFIKHFPLASIGSRTLGARIYLVIPCSCLTWMFFCCSENHYNIFFSPQKEHFYPVNASPPPKPSGVNGKMRADFIMKSSGNMVAEKQGIWKWIYYPVKHLSYLNPPDTSPAGK